MALIGLFFGSFNPIHNGHLAIAKYLLNEGYCEEVWFVVSPQNPWKVDATLLEEQKRLELVKLAISDDLRLKVCDIEFSMPRPSYTYRTLSALKEKFSYKQFALIMGGDNLRNFHLWRNHQEILEGYPLLVYPRPGVDLSGWFSPTIQIVNAPLLPVSSTEIRQKIVLGEDISADVPEGIVSLVKQYYS